MTIQRLSHIGICVSDLERSVRFYRDTLCFTELSRFNVEGEQAATLIELPSGKIQTVYLEREGVRIELLYYPELGSEEIPAPRPMNRVGLTHLSLRVEDLDKTLAEVVNAGGTCLTQSRVENKDWGTKAIFVTDPDGLRIELLQIPGDPNALPGS